MRGGSASPLGTCPPAGLRRSRLARAARRRPSCRRPVARAPADPRTVVEIVPRPALVRPVLSVSGDRAVHECRVPGGVTRRSPRPSRLNGPLTHPLHDDVRPIGDGQERLGLERPVSRSIVMCSAPRYAPNECHGTCHRPAVGGATTRTQRAPRLPRARAHRATKRWASSIIVTPARLLTRNAPPEGVGRGSSPIAETLREAFATNPMPILPSSGIGRGAVIVATSAYVGVLGEDVFDFDGKHVVPSAGVHLATPTGRVGDVMPPTVRSRSDDGLRPRGSFH